MSDKPTILIVDDEADAVEFTRAVLGQLGDFTILAAGDGADGFQKAKAARPDLIILDVQMPGRGGFDMFLDLKKEPSTQDIPVVMLTGVAEKRGLRFSAEAMGEYMHAEPEAYLEKPVDPAALQKTVSQILGL